MASGSENYSSIQCDHVHMCNKPLSTYTTLLNCSYRYKVEKSRGQTTWDIKSSYTAKPVASFECLLLHKNQTNSFVSHNNEISKVSI